MFTLICALVVIAIIVLALHIVGWCTFVPHTMRILEDIPLLLCQREKPIDGAQSVQFKSRDGLQLHGEYIKTSARHRLGVVMYCHETNGDRWNAKPFAKWLLDNGYDLFSFDFRNCGLSEKMDGYEIRPWATGFEIGDVRGAVDYLTQRSDADPAGIFALGLSRGGTTAFCALSNDPRVRGLVIDGLLPLESMQYHFAQKFMASALKSTKFAKLWPASWVSSSNFWARIVFQLKYKCRLANVPRAARRANVPVLLIHGGRDSYIPTPLVKSVLHKMRDTSDLWVVDGMKHNRAVHEEPQEYQDRVRQFLGQQKAVSDSKNDNNPARRNAARRRIAKRRRTQNAPSQTAMWLLGKLGILPKTT